MSMMAAVLESEIPVEEPPQPYKPHRVFINHVDSFKSKYIAEYITSQIYGASKIIPIEGGAEALGESEEAIPKPVDNAPTERYQFIGTLSSPLQKSNENIRYIIDGDDHATYLEEIMNCGYIIYDITNSTSEISKALKTLTLIEKEFEKIKAIGEKTFEQTANTKVFILISTIMTWASTKPLDPDDPDLPFSEVDYKKRRPHPNYKSHFACEKQVMKMGQKYGDKLKTYVICSALTYGEEEDDLEVFFRMAWCNEIIPIFHPGNNKVPLIHVRDLAKAVHGIMENLPRKPQYILAIEQTPTIWKNVMKSLSKAMSNGKTINVSAEEAFLYPNITQTIFERCQVHLNIEPVFLMENLQIQWHNEANIAENMLGIIKEFKKTRKLNPVKIILHGPPGCGKTAFAKKICDHYNLHYVSIQSMLDETLQELKDHLKSLENPELKPHDEYLEEEVEEEEEEDEEDPEVLRDQIKEMELLMDKGADHVSDDYLLGLLKTFLSKNKCQNRGFVLDDYPRTADQAKELFGIGQGPDEESEDLNLMDADKILPDLVVSFEISDQMVCSRIMALCEDTIKDTPYAEESIIKRLEIFRSNNTDEETILNLFDEMEIDLEVINIDKDELLENAFAIVLDRFGDPAGFGITLEEQYELARIAEEDRRLQKEKDEIDKLRVMEEVEEVRKRKMEYWAETLTRLQIEEEKILVAQSEPLRHYLTKYIFPLLTKGLIELATLKPDDPIDFLADFLFRHNPEAKMFDPSFNEDCESLYDDFRRYVGSIVDDNVLFDR